ncbi:molybdopterin-guanine dinucleotide biosynthesis protein B [Acidocella sp.]|uniref:molybdopterin-guanine dinucleotide biosynthesis protein B n=1 Tax=Acidocella sp. TaxID=50710 RepID=UPI003D090FFA
MAILAISGWSGAGKTTLIASLIPLFKARGIGVSSIKHAHHGVTLDKPGKDSFIHAEAGAREVILATDGGFALFSHAETPLPLLVSRLSPVDLVLVEGFKSAPMPRLAVYRPSLGKPAPWPDPHLLAVASDAPLPDCPVPVLPLGAPPRIADFLIRVLGLNGESHR